MSERYPTERLARGEVLPLDPGAPMPSTLGRYVLGPRLGSGGMAEVYRAFDATLERHVAIKFLRETDGEHLTRFLREARAQAQVGHDNICDVYETGIIEGRPFIAMRWIDGLTLADAAPRMSTEEKVAVMVDVAEAVHAAHRIGLVHRDLKPNNIMVEAKPDGGWHAWVLDFGLARDASMETMTTIGAVVGTPPYMAPEQARAERERIDRRTDVYSLGATLFDVLSGRPPFVADSMVDVMMKVVTEDAPSLRTLVPSIPADLDTIVMKCLEKDPQRRYESARALAEDLRRYLDGEPIQARRTTFVHRWVRRARRHPTMAALLAVAGLAVLASLAWAVTTSLQSAERQRAAQRFGQEVERIEAVARYSNMLPLHDVRRERQWIRDRIARIEREAQSMSRTAAGPARYAIGRGYLALREWQPGRAHLEAAWSAGYRTPETAYALGRAIGAQYQEELEEAERIAGAEARAARLRQIEKQYRDAALSWLRRGRSAGGESPAYSEGLIALYEKRYDDALGRARVAFREVPWMHEARKLEGDIWLIRGVEQAN
ncbi:MAG TPA: protein kinase, partial [Thermoanaerobaculia bacterium]|nr:protein kinase [Thermoanaerobaculia bacterium]